MLRATCSSCSLPFMKHKISSCFENIFLHIWICRACIICMQIYTFDKYITHSRMWNILIKCFCLHIYCTIIRMCEKNCLIWIVGRFRKCRWNVAQRYRTEVKIRCLAYIEIKGGLTSDRYGRLICSRRRTDIEQCYTSEIRPMG